jgi:hypothetical protein
MTSAQAMAFVRKHGVVLASGKGPVPNLADAVAHDPIRGSWWAHPKGHEIFQVLSNLNQSREVLVCRLVAGKITYVHRRLWPALVRAASHFSAEQLAQVRQEHTEKGHHVSHSTPYPEWVPADVKREAERLSDSEAVKALGQWVGGA